MYLEKSGNPGPPTYVCGHHRKTHTVKKVFWSSKVPKQNKKLEADNFEAGQQNSHSSFSPSTNLPILKQRVDLLFYNNRAGMTQKTVFKIHFISEIASCKRKRFEFL
jgi:hypothetical protein